jgi:chemotaxis protein histidine kinase CheA
MNAVNDGILKGVNQTIQGMPLDKRSKMGAFNGFKEGLKLITDQFASYVAAKQTAATTPVSTGFKEWAPAAWTIDVCCMDGMDCWTAEFAKNAWLEKTKSEYYTKKAELEKATKLYNLLNKDNVAKQNQAKQKAFADAKDLSLNKASELRTMNAQMATLKKDPAANIKKISDLQAKLDKVNEEKLNIDATYANLNLKEANEKVEKYTTSVKERAETMANTKAQEDFANKRITELKTAAEIKKKGEAGFDAWDAEVKKYTAESKSFKDKYTALEKN